MYLTYCKQGDRIELSLAGDKLILGIGMHNDASGYAKSPERQAIIWIEHAGMWMSQTVRDGQGISFKISRRLAGLSTVTFWIGGRLKLAIDAPPAVEIRKRSGEEATLLTDLVA